MNIFGSIDSLACILSKLHSCGEPSVEIHLKNKSENPHLELSCCHAVIELENFIMVDFIPKEIIEWKTSLSSDSCDIIESNQVDAIENIMIQENREHLEDTELLPDPLYCDKRKRNDSKLNIDHLPKVIPTSSNSLVMCNPDCRKQKYPQMLICEFCAKQFTGKDRAYKFSHHRNKEHTKEIQYECPECQKIYWGERELNAHLLSHSTPPQVCDICGTTWSSGAQLNRHLITHQKHKLHSCSHCKATFKRKDHMTVHERTHTGQMPYKCTGCGSGYPQKRQLCLHQKKCQFLEPLEAAVS